MRIRLPGLHRPTPAREPLADELMAARLEQECALLSAVHRLEAEYGFDPEAACWWVCTPDWELPAGMTANAATIIFELPAGYPSEGPRGIYVPLDLAWIGGQPVSLVFGMRTKGREDGWAYCRMPDGWRSGDDLGRALGLIAVSWSAVAAYLTVGREAITATDLSAMPAAEEMSDNG